MNDPDSKASSTPQSNVTEKQPAPKTNYSFWRQQSWNSIAFFLLVPVGILMLLCCLAAEYGGSVGPRIATFIQPLSMVLILLLTIVVLSVLRKMNSGRPLTAQKMKPKEFWSSMAASAMIAAVVMNAPALKRSGFFDDPDEYKVSKTEMQLEANQATKRKSQERTLYFWNHSVVPMASIRFELPHDNESAADFYERKKKQLRLILDEISQLITQDVDHDVVELVRSQYQIDEAFLSLVGKAEVFSNKLRLGRDDVPMQKRMEEGRIQFFAFLAAPEKLERIRDPEFRQFAKDAQELELNLIETASKNEVMQAVLQERYPGTIFPLPELPLIP